MIISKNINKLTLNAYEKNVQLLSHKYVEKGNRFHVVFQLSFYGH